MEASKAYDNLHDILDMDIANDTVKAPGSHSRNLRRVRQGLDLVRALFEQFLSTKYAMPLPCYFTYVLHSRKINRYVCCSLRHLSQ